MFKSKAGTILMEKMSWIADILIFSILWFIFSIPIVSVGAATSAMYRSIQSRIQNGDGEIWGVFWRTFKSSLPQATVSWLIYLLLALIFGLNQVLLTSNLAMSWLNHFSQVFLLVLLIAIAPVLIMVFAYTSRFEDQLKTVWKNTSLLALAYFKDTLYILFVLAVSVSIVYLVPILVVFIPAYAISKICPRLETIFNRYTDEDLLEKTNSNAIL